MEPMLGSTLKVCGFCSQLTEEVETLFPGMMTFLESFLRTPAVRVPTKLCPDCLRRASNAKKFQEKSLRAFEKLEKNGISVGLVWGREGECLGMGSGGVEYNRRLHGPLKFPLVTLTATDRALAEAHSKSSTIRRGEEEVEEGEEGEEGEEVFPAVGPFQCEICREVSTTKQMFVSHIKTQHWHSVDPQVLRALELDLKKRKQKVEKNSAAAKTSERRKRRREGEKRPYSHRQDLQYVDLAGNILPRAAGKCPGEDQVLVINT